VKAAIAEMICLREKYSKQRELVDHLPEFVGEFLAVEPIWQRK
jgi:hypothetical protein